MSDEDFIDLTQDDHLAINTDDTPDGDDGPQDDVSQEPVSEDDVDADDDVNDES